MIMEKMTVDKIDIKKRYYGELSEVSKLTEEEELRRDLSLTIYKKLEEWFETKKHKKEQCISIINAFFAFSSYINKKANLNDSNSNIELFKEDILKRSSKQMEEFVESLIDEYSKLYQVEPSEISYPFLHLAMNEGCYQPSSRTLTFITQHKGSLSFIEGFTEVSNEILDTEYQEEIKRFMQVKDEDNEIVKECIREHHIELFGYEIAQQLQPMEEIVVEKLDKKRVLTTIAQFVKKHRILSVHVYPREKEVLEDILYQPSLKFITEPMNEAIFKLESQDVHQGVTSSNETGKTNEEIKQICHNLLSASLGVDWDKAKEILDKAIERKFIIWTGDSEKLTWTQAVADFDYMFGILICGDYRKKDDGFWRYKSEKDNRCWIWDTDKDKPFPRKALTKVFNKPKGYNTSSKQKWGEERCKKCLEKNVPKGYEAIESLFTAEWQEKWNHQIKREGS